MPVLVEMFSLVAPAGTLRTAVDPGHPSFVDDGVLDAVSFRSHDELGQALADLEVEGHVPLRGGEPGDIAVVDQLRGPALWWPWLELAVVRAPGGGRALAARRAGDPRVDLAVPRGWRHARSASARFGVGELPMADRPLRHLRREASHDLYVDGFTGGEVWLRREHAPVRLAVRGPRGRGEVRAELVTRWQEVEVGLMFRDALGVDEGMLFRFGTARAHGFWMKNTRVSLDILFVDAAGKVVNVAERTEPLRLRQHRSAGPVMDVLEVPGGWCQAHGVGAGARVTVDPTARG